MTVTTLAKDLLPERHGSHSTYANYHCRCEPCKDAERAYVTDRKARRPVRVPAFLGKPHAPRPSLKRDTDIWPGKP